MQTFRLEFLLRFFLFLIFLPGSANAQKPNIYNITNFGAIPDGKTINTQAINDAIQTCHDGGGGTVEVPAGVFMSGTIRLLSNVNLHLEPGAVISGSKDTSDYLTLHSPLFHEGYSRYGLLFAKDAVNISLTGSGLFRGNGTGFMHDLNRPNNFFWLDRSVTRQGADFMKQGTISEDGPFSYDYRPGMLFTFDHCENIHLTDIQIKDPPEWTMRIGDCNNVTIRGIDIDNNPLIPNNDGINCTSSSNVRISDCHIFTGDDAIAISSYENQDPVTDSIGNRSGIAENFTVDNCILSSRSSCIRIGDGTQLIHRMVFSNIVMYASNRGIGIFARDYTNIEDLIFSNIVIHTHLYSGNWWGKGEPIHISAVKATANGQTGKIKNIRFSNITADAETGILIYGIAESYIEDIFLDRVSLTIHSGKNSVSYGGNFDLQPMYPSNIAIFKHDIPGLYAQYVKNLNISGFTLTWGQRLPSYFTQGVEINHFKNVRIEGMMGGPAFPSPSMSGILLEDGTGVRTNNNVGPDLSEIIITKRNVATND
jgi:polygalacturonase